MARRIDINRKRGATSSKEVKSVPPTVGGAPVSSVPVTKVSTVTVPVAHKKQDEVYTLSAVAAVNVPVFSRVPKSLEEAKIFKTTMVSVDVGKAYSLLSTQEFGVDSMLVFAPLLVANPTTGAVLKYAVPVGKNTSMAPNACSELVSTDLDFFFRDFTL